MPRGAHRPSQRVAILDAAVSVVREGGSLSLDSAARCAGVSKPGLMYHFGTKEALVGAVVEHLIDGYERELQMLLKGRDPGPRERLAAYVRWSLTCQHSAADLVMFTDPKLRPAMVARWSDRFRPWVEPPPGATQAQRARFNLARLMADGCWVADASGVLPVSHQDRPALLRAALELLEGEEA